MRTAIALSLLALTLLCSGCETTAEKSAKLERTAKRVTPAKQKGLEITRASTVVKVLDAAVIQGKEGTAAVVTLRNASTHALSEVPISLELKDAHGASVYSNGTPGLARTLTSVALLPAHAQVVWIDDQIQAATATQASARVGEGTEASGVPPRLNVAEQHLSGEPDSSSLEGAVHNGSRTDQPELVIDAVARRGGRMVAAGRAVLASLDASATTPFQIFFVGDPTGAKLTLSVPPTASG
ncbi:MAG TPA: hypothetical protein VHW67_11420 [Solirubrobacteraceae bacterium]|jgi:hypothetical protein|nr:hypothetical protein [Solirubrobacteraceae bacterium]